MGLSKEARAIARERQRAARARFDDRSAHDEGRTYYDDRGEEHIRVDGPDAENVVPFSSDGV